MYLSIQHHSSETVITILTVEFDCHILYFIFLPQLGPNVYVGSGVTIGPGARVKEAIILDRAEIMVNYRITQRFKFFLYLHIGTLLCITLYYWLGM